MELLILRHAIAFPRNAKRWPNDAERTLTMEGVQRARRAAVGLKRMAQRPALVLTSPLVRARDTAAIFARAARWPDAVECTALSPGGSPEDVLEACAARAPKPNASQSSAISHTLAGCSRYLCGATARGEAFELKKSAVACVQFEGPPQRPSGRAQMALYPNPRALRTPPQID